MLECGMAASIIIEGKAPLAVVRGEFFCGECHASGCHVAVLCHFGTCEWLCGRQNGR